MSIRINGECYSHYGLSVEIAKRPKTVLLTACQWVGHQSSAAEGPIAEVRIVRGSAAECVAELERQWMALAGKTEYVGFGGQFRHAAYYSAAEVAEAIDAVEEALEKAGLTADAESR